MTREEALNEIRSWAIPSEKGREVLETLIPELAESEDERIRKEIINYILYKADGVSEEDEHRWVTWLEKQKEQKPVHFELKAGKWYICHRAFCCRADHLTVKEGERFQCEKDGIVKGFVIKEPEKYFKECSAPAPMEDEQKEQKPDSLIYDKDLDKAAREFYLSGGAASPVDSTGLVPIVRMAEFGATWMKERMEKEQKPCWNPTEEDVALFNKAITTNASLSPQERAKLDILRMKFKHRPVIEQKEQKPVEKQDYSGLNDLERVIHRGFLAAGVENVPVTIIKETAQECLTNIKPAWSEEDETYLQDALWCIEKAEEVAKDENDMGNCWCARRWLKSLRPQLKKELSIEKAIQWLDDTFYFLDNSGGRGRDCEITTHDFDSLEEMYDSFRKAVTVDYRPSWKPSEE